MLFNMHFLACFESEDKHLEKGFVGSILFLLQTSEVQALYETC